MNGPIAPISITGPPAIAALLVLWWYYNRLNRPDVPPSRRKIRQASIVIMVLEVPLLLVGTSFTDHRADQVRFVAVWLAAILLLVIVIWLMVVDGINSLLIGRRQRWDARARLLQERQQLEGEICRRTDRSDRSGVSSEPDGSSSIERQPRKNASEP